MNNFNKMPESKSIAEQLKEKEAFAKELIRKGEEEHEETKGLVGEHLDELVDEASSDYQEVTKKKIKDAIDKENYGKAGSLADEMKKHVERIEHEKRIHTPWWKRYPGEWDWTVADMTDADFITAEEFIKNNPERVRELQKLDSMDYKLAVKSGIDEISATEKKVLTYFSCKRDMITVLNKEGRKEEAEEV